MGDTYSSPAEQTLTVDAVLPDGQTVSAEVNLTAGGCYFMRTGRCSLEIVSDFSLPVVSRLTECDLLFCPRLYRMMRQEKTGRAVTVTVDDTGRARVTAGLQRACIAFKKEMPLNGRIGTPTAVKRRKK